MLHLIFNSPVDPTILERMATGDVGLFLDNAVISLLKNGKLAGLLTQRSGEIRFYALQEDLDIRGISNDELVGSVEAINYQKFVQLTVDNTLIQSWT